MILRGTECKTFPMLADLRRPDGGLNPLDHRTPNPRPAVIPRAARASARSRRPGADPGRGRGSGTRSESRRREESRSANHAGELLLGRCVLAFPRRGEVFVVDEGGIQRMDRRPRLSGARRGAPAADRTRPRGRGGRRARRRRPAPPSRSRPASAPPSNPRGARRGCPAGCRSCRRA